MSPLAAAGADADASATAPAAPVSPLAAAGPDADASTTAAPPATAPPAAALVNAHSPADNYIIQSLDLAGVPVAGTAASNSAVTNATAPPATAPASNSAVTNAGDGAGAPVFFHPSGMSVIFEDDEDEDKIPEIYVAMTEALIALDNTAEAYAKIIIPDIFIRPLRIADVWKTNMQSAIDTTKNAQERIEFAFSAIDKLKNQNLESILSNKEKVIETFELAWNKEAIFNNLFNRFQNILNSSISDISHYDDINESLTKYLNKVQKIRDMVEGKILEIYPDMRNTLGGNKKTRKHKNKVNKKNKSKKNKSKKNKSKKNKSKKNKK